jgi:hypothetical protein
MPRRVYAVPSPEALRNRTPAAAPVTATPLGQREWLQLREAAAYLGYTTENGYTNPLKAFDSFLRAAGRVEIPVVKVGGGRKAWIKRVDLDRALEQRRAPLLLARGTR